MKFQSQIVSYIIILLQQNTFHITHSFTLHPHPSPAFPFKTCKTHSRVGSRSSSSSSTTTTTTTITKRYMGLYDDIDEDLPELPKDYISKRRTRDDIRNQKLQTFINTDDYLEDEKDEFGQILPDVDISSSIDKIYQMDDDSANIENDDDIDDDNDDDDDDYGDATFPNLFEWNLDGSEKNQRLPDLSRSLYNGIPCYYEPTDKKVQIVMEKTECSAQDACWALEAHEGKIMEAMIDIAMAQRNVLNDSVSLPDQEEVQKTDWDEELKALTSGVDGDGKSKKKKMELGEEFEQAGYSIGMDGLEERKQNMRKRGMVDGMKRMLDGGDVDQDWIPGKKNPNPIDDEPWFTG